MNKIIKYIGTAAIASMMAGCTTGFEEYNKNPYQPDKVPADNLLSTMFNVFAYPQQNACQTINCMWASFSGQVTATANWSFGENIFAYYNASDKHNDSSWGTIYGYVYPYFYLIETSTEKKGVTYAMAQLTRVYAMHTLASLQGPIPYSKMKAGETEAPYDNEATVWHAMFNDLDNAIAILKSAAVIGVNQDLAAVDQFYKGDCSKWLKFANTLKLRMAIRISGIEPDFAKVKGEEAVLDGVLESASESAYDTTNSGINENGYAIISGWPEVRANACLVSYMNGYNDPRRPAFFTPQAQNSTGGYVGVRSGSAEIPEPTVYANYSKLYIASDKTLPQPVMYAAEAAFLRAEGALKHWNMGGDAKTFYEKGIRLSFEEFGVSGVDAYLADDTSVPGDYVDDLVSGHSGNNYTNQSSITIKWDDNASDAEKLERVLTQKWIACYPDPMNGWADFRRTGYPKIFPATKSMNSDCTTMRGQRRLRFTLSEYNNNKANVEAAVGMLSNGKDSNGTDLWWAMKENGTY